MSATALPPFLQDLHRGAEQLWLAAHHDWPELRIEVLPETDSTNSQLMQRARHGQRDTVVMTTAHQTAGRGRLGRQWQDQPGQTLMFSVGMPLTRSDVSGLSLCVGVALAEVLGPPVQLKWPNDLWVKHQGQWRKLGGVLTEIAHDGQHAYVVVGVGINLHSPPPLDSASVAPIGLSAFGHAATADQCLADLAGAVLRALRAFMRDGFTPWMQRFNTLDALANQPVQLSDGRQGTARGVASDGALLLETSDQRLSIHSQEVSVRPC